VSFRTLTTPKAFARENLIILDYGAAATIGRGRGAATFLDTSIINLFMTGGQAIALLAGGLSIVFVIVVVFAVPRFTLRFNILSTLFTAAACASGGIIVMVMMIAVVVIWEP
jgi:hypothetical protein